MGKNKPSGTDQNQGDPKSVSNAEMERRLLSLETSVKEVSNNLVDRHLRTITIVFSCVTGLIAVCALLVTILGYISKSDVQQATTRMENRTDKASSDLDAKTDKAITEMNQKFQALAGEALKRPLLRVFTPDGPLDGQVFEVAGQTPFYPVPLFIANDGDKSTEPLSVRQFFSVPVSLNGFAFQQFLSSDKDYPVGYYLDFTELSRFGAPKISAKETWTFESVQGVSLVFTTTNRIECKMEIFYGADKPCEAKFTLKLKH